MNVTIDSIEASQQEHLIFFYIHRTYRSDMSDDELYDITRQYWYNVAEAVRNGKTPYKTAIGVVNGLVVSAYTIQSWHQAGETPSTRDVNAVLKGKTEKWWEFTGTKIYSHDLLNCIITRNGQAIPNRQNGFTYHPAR